MLASNPVIEAIRSRRTVRKLLADKKVDKHMVQTILDAAIWAPNHHLTEPWRFVVIAGDERKRLGDALAAAMAALPGSPAPSPERIEAERAKPLTAPVIIAVVSNPKQDKNIVPQEELVAAGAALENILLAAHSLGLASNIKTGWHSYSPAVGDFFGMKPAEALVGMVYLGYPAEAPPPGKRSGLEGKVSWQGM